MTMSSPNRYRDGLEKLAAEPPRTKTALLRFLLPKIERALTFGKTSKQVCQYWVEEGVEIDYRTFHRLFRRVRTKFSAMAGASGKSAERWAKGEDGETKTEATDGYVPLHAVLAHFL